MQKIMSIDKNIYIFKKKKKSLHNFEPWKIALYMIPVHHANYDSELHGIRKSLQSMPTEGWSYLQIFYFTSFSIFFIL